MKGVILAGGLGKAFRPLSHSGPKQLVPIANKPVLHYVIDDLAEAGIREIGIIVGYTADRIKAIKDSAGDGSRWGCRITYIEQDAPRGLAHAVGICREFTGEDNFVVYLGDNMIKGGISSYVRDFDRSRCGASLLLTEVDEPQKYGVAVLDSSGNLVELEEKPKNPRSNLAVIGIYVFSPQIYKMIDTIKPSARGELEITDAIAKMLKTGVHKVLARKITGWWDDTGTIDAVLNANVLVLGDIQPGVFGEIAAGVEIPGNVRIGKGTRILGDTVIHGPGIIGEDCVIGPGSVIGSYTSIGDRVVIEGGEVERSIIYNDVVIRYGRKIADSIIGDFAVITSGRKRAGGDRLIVGSHSKIDRSA